MHRAAITGMLKAFTTVKAVAEHAKIWDSAWLPWMGIPQNTNDANHLTVLKELLLEQPADQVNEINLCVAALNPPSQLKAVVDVVHHGAWDQNLKAKTAKVALARALGLSVWEALQQHRPTACRLCGVASNGAAESGVSGLRRTNTDALKDRLDEALLHVRGCPGARPQLHNSKLHDNMAKEIGRASCRERV